MEKFVSERDRTNWRIDDEEEKRKAGEHKKTWMIYANPVTIKSSGLNDRQFDELIKEIKYQEIKVLFSENQERDCAEGGIRYIIDKDGCEIY